MQTDKRTASGLVEFVKEKMVQPNIYLWGAMGQFLTSGQLDRRSARSEYWYTEEKLSVRRALQDRGIRGYDCIGLVKCYVFHDFNQYNTQYYDSSLDMTTKVLVGREDAKKGPIDTLPEKPGLILWKEGHVGVYIGSGKVIECTIQAPNQPNTLIGGIYETKLEERAWEKWIEYPGISYNE